MADRDPNIRRSTPPLGTCDGRIGVFRALHLGDMLCAVPALRALRALCPRARITVIGLPGIEAFARRFSAYIDDCLVFPGHPQLPETETPRARYEAFRAAFPGDFAWLVQLHGDGRVTNALVREWPARHYAGFVAGDGEWTANTLVYPREGHEIDRLLALMAALGAHGSDDLEFPLGASDEADLKGHADLCALVKHPYVIVHAGARDARRRLPGHRFAKAVAWLGARIPVVLTGTRAEEADAAILAGIPGVVNAIGRTTLGALGVLIRGARFVITHDTGPSHLCAALATPSLVVVVGSDPARWAPKARARHRVLDARCGLADDALLRGVRDLWRATEEGLWQAAAP